MPAHKGAGRTRPVLVLTLIAHVLAIALFVHGYLLTRIHLPNRSEPSSPVCARPYKKLVWIVIDALRYDFVISDGRYPCGGCTHQGKMPRLTALLAAHPAAARGFRYIAAAPTTTTQRLKAMVAGSLPAFFDVSNAFTARPMDEDNLIDAAAAAKWRLSFVGDATWAALFPTQFNKSLTFPCFNVKDLHTVDDGVWAHLPDALAAPGDWDALVAHYLGVDHAGHAHGVDSPEMSAKLGQMDAHVAVIVEKMAGEAGPGGAYEDALLLVAGDHGQTLGGDHGGGSPEEVDSVLVAVDLGALARYLRGEGGGGDVGALPPPACVKDCTCGEDGNQCVADLPQIDAVPALAALLGLPVPFGNLGRLSTELWALGAGRCAGGGGAAAQARALARATAANAAQVMRYLNTYAAHPAAAFPSAALRRLNDAFRGLSGMVTDDDDLSNCGEDGGSDCGAAAHLEFLAEAAAVAARAWAQFDDVSMVGGVTALVLVVVTQFWVALRALGGVFDSSSEPQSWRTWAPTGVAWAGVVAHLCGIFSFFYLLSEGKSISCILAGVILALTVLRATTRGASGPARGRAVAVGVATAGLIYASSAMGLVSHSGYGFWQRLTVHEPADIVGDVAGAGGAWALLWEALEGTAPWQVVAEHVIKYIAPLAILYYWISSGIGPSRNGLAIRLQRSLISLEFTVLAVHEALERGIAQGWLPRGLTAAQAAAALVPGAPPLHHPVSHLSLHLLLPRIVFFAGAASLALLLLRTVQGGASVPLTRFCSVLRGTLLPVLVLISTTFSPLLALICSLESAGLAALAAGSPRPAAATLAALFSLQLTRAFFVTGHLCEFSGLQWTAGFVGYEEFGLLRSGALVAVDAFGGMALAALDMAAVGSTLTNDKTARAGKGRSGEMVGPVLLLACAARTAVTAAATLSAAIQRRHLYAWALFAPKFAFEVFFLAATDLLLLGLAAAVGA